MDVTLTPVGPSFSIDLLAFILGLCVGSFLNVVALRSLAEESVFWPPSKCPRCNHQLSPLDNIPLLSWLFLGGKCRYCSTPIHWQYPVVELFTAVTFVAIERMFLDFDNSPLNTEYWNGLLQSFRFAPLSFPDGYDPNLIWFMIGGMLYFACTLIAVSVTDFREKLIPHEITYPSILIGILFSAFVRQDLLGAMAGIGASYILFDFIAFYGLKVYMAMHGGTDDGPIRERRLRRRLKPRVRRKLNRSLKWRLDLATIQRKQIQEEPMEVMGGGDAVLSALMAAFLGWQFLVVALIIGFVVGTIMGLGLLIREMHKANLLHKCVRSCAIWAAGCATALGTFGLIMDSTVGQGSFAMTAPLAVLGAFGGLLLGVVSVGTQVSKPYPFGPALAVGGLISIFLMPNWLYLHAIAPTQH
jgi:leader peptidase (prepilin peptidase)/N-methyltransferase